MFKRDYQYVYETKARHRKNKMLKGEILPFLIVQ